MPAEFFTLGEAGNTAPAPRPSPGEAGNAAPAPRPSPDEAGNAAPAPQDRLPEDFWTAKLRECPVYLEYKSLQDLYAEAFVSPPPVIENLLVRGVYLLAGPPKIGKSFLVAQLAYHVSLGMPIWGYSVRQGTVLYLALEDDEERLQKRMYRMYGPHDTDELYFAQTAGGVRR